MANERLEPRLPNEWRVGDVVVVDDRYKVTNLGEGVVLDVETYPQTHSARAALVRFANGPANGVWCAVGTLRQIRDLYGAPLPEPEQQVNSAPPQRQTAERQHGDAAAEEQRQTRRRRDSPSPTGCSGGRYPEGRK